MKKLKYFILGFFKFIFICLCISCLNGKEKSNNVFSLLVTISSSDCLNCSAVLYNLKQKDIAYSFLVETEKNKNLVRAALKLSGNEGSFVIDEKMYKEFNAENLSWVIIAKGKELIKRVSIKELDKIIPFYNGLRRNTNNLKKYMLPDGLECSKNVFFDVYQNSFFVLDRFTSNFYACSIEEGRTVLGYKTETNKIAMIDLFRAKMNDTLGFSNFLKVYNQTKRIQPNCLKIINFNVNEGGIFIGIELQMPRVVSKDNITLEPDYFIGQIVGGEFIRIIYVPRPIDSGNFPRLDAGFFVKNEQLFTYFSSKQLWETSYNDCHNFLVRYKIDSNNQCIANSPLDVCQPHYWADQSLKNLDMFNFCQSIGYFVHFPWFAIYNNSDVAVVEIPKIAIDYTNVKGFPPEKGIIISSVMQSDKTFFVSYYNQEESAYKEVIYNLASNEVVAIKTVCPYPDFTFDANLKYQTSSGYLYGINLDKRILYRF